MCVCVCACVCVCVCVCVCASVYVGERWYASLVPHTEGDATPHTRTSTNLMHYPLLKYSVCVRVCGCVCVSHNWESKYIKMLGLHTLINFFYFSITLSLSNTRAHTHTQNTHPNAVLCLLISIAASPWQQLMPPAVLASNRRSSLVTTGNGGSGCKHLH